MATPRGAVARSTRRRPVGDGDVDHASTFVREDDEDDEQATRRRWDDDEVGGHDLSDVVRQEGFPGWRWRAPAAGHVLRHRGLRDVDADLQPFPVDARRTQSGFACDIVRISSRTSRDTGGRPV